MKRFVQIIFLAVPLYFWTNAVRADFIQSIVLSMEEGSPILEVQKCIITGDDVNFRSTPYREKRNIIGRFNLNDTVVFLSEYTIRDDYGNAVETWCYVRRRDGKEGWVFSEFVQCR